MEKMDLKFTAERSRRWAWFDRCWNFARDFLGRCSESPTGLIWLSFGWSVFLQKSNSPHYKKIKLFCASPFQRPNSKAKTLKSSRAKSQEHVVLAGISQHHVFCHYLAHVFIVIMSIHFDITTKQRNSAHLTMKTKAMDIDKLIEL